MSLWDARDALRVLTLAVCVDGLATRVQRPHRWANQKVFYDAKLHAHTAQGLSVSTIWGDLLQAGLRATDTLNGRVRRRHMSWVTAR